MGYMVRVAVHGAGEGERGRESGREREGVRAGEREGEGEREGQQLTAWAELADGNQRLVGNVESGGVGEEVAVEDALVV
jgi:hypothetical protein